MHYKWFIYFHTDLFLFTSVGKWTVILNVIFTLIFCLFISFVWHFLFIYFHTIFSYDELIFSHVNCFNNEFIGTWFFHKLLMYSFSHGHLIHFFSQWCFTWCLEFIFSEFYFHNVHFSHDSFTLKFSHTRRYPSI